jgi:uncharacterized protein
MKPPPARSPHLPHPSLKHPGRWLWVFLLIPVLLGFARLRFDVEVFDLLPSDLPAVQGLKLYQDHFANARELIIALKAGSPEEAETAARSIAEGLRPLTNLVASVTWEPPWLEHPELSSELMAYLWLNQPPAALEDLTNRLAPEKIAETLKETREALTTSMSPQEIARLSYDPLGLTRLPESAEAAAPSFARGQEMFGSIDGKFRIVFVQARPELRSYHECIGWLARIQTAVSAAVAGEGSTQGLRVGYTGRPAFYAEVAGGMQHDMTISVGGTAAIIAVLFWLAHRRVKPMLWLLALLALILGSTLALGGLIYGTINVVSMGFAAILLGLAVDYAVVHYQEALAHPRLSIPQIRHAIAPSIFWGATTTIAAFLVLNMGGLPGLGQLGTLVGLGVALAALIMVFEFLPPLFPGRNEPIPEPLPSTATASPFAPRPANRLRVLLSLGITIGVVGLTSVILAFGQPRIDPTGNALRPRKSQAYATLDEIQSALNQKQEPLWLIVQGRTVEETGARLDQVQAVLNRAVTNRWLKGATLPTMLWPRIQFQEQNRKIIERLIANQALFHSVALSNGFAPSSLALTDGILQVWRRAASTPGAIWPTNAMSQWILQKVTARSDSQYFALGLLNLPPGAAAAAAVHAIESELPQSGVLLSGWQLLGNAIFSRVKANLWKVVGPMVVLVLLSLLFAFRRLGEILLSLGTLVLGGLCLLSVMRLARWDWNLLNLMAIPLVLGTGVDYSIFMQLALRRYQGDTEMAYNSVGRALLLCGGTAIAGFGSLAWSSNAGMASLGKVCAVGIGSNMLIAIFLLPVWWSRTVNRSRSEAPPTPLESSTSPPQVTDKKSAQPSSLYSAALWRLAIGIVRFLPRKVCARLSLLAVTLYWALASHRRQVVICNLLPAVHGEKRIARRKARELFRQFGLKLLDLWRFEGGEDVGNLLGTTSGWEHFLTAQAQNRGVLLLTPHLGNWEFGGPLMTSRGVSLQVLTMAEPGRGFTEIRQAARARWKIETLVVGSDPLAFVEVIRRLEKGATVALLVDRPPPPTALTVELFGRPFAASVSAAELARASGCVLLPVYLPRKGGRYEAHILPPIPYERAALRDREARRVLTQRIISTFEPVIRDHLDQWYHFVPIWGQSSTTDGRQGTSR